MSSRTGSELRKSAENGPPQISDDDLLRLMIALEQRHLSVYRRDSSRGREGSGENQLGSKRRRNARGSAGKTVSQASSKAPQSDRGESDDLRSLRSLAVAPVDIAEQEDNGNGNPLSLRLSSTLGATFVEQLDPLTRKPLRRYSSQREAALTMNIPYKTIKRCCQKGEAYAHGFLWRHCDDPPNECASRLLEPLFYFVDLM